MMRRVISFLVSVGIILGFVAPLAYATDVVSCDGLTAAQCKLVSEDKLNYKSNTNIVWDIVRFIFLILGGVAVVMIIVGGIQYTTSRGDSGAVSKAKNTILYAVIGLVVALLASAIVTFIINTVVNASK